MEYISEICEECLCGSCATSISDICSDTRLGSNLCQDSTCRHCQGKYPVISEKDCEFFSEEEE